MLDFIFIQRQNSFTLVLLSNKTLTTRILSVLMMSVIIMMMMMMMMIFFRVNIAVNIDPGSKSGQIVKIR